VVRHARAQFRDPDVNDGRRAEAQSESMTIAGAAQHARKPTLVA
jgi:hypothetical protein